MFNKEEHILRMKPHLSKLILHLTKNNIEFIPADNYGGNVVLRSPTKELKISHRCFYRFSGLAVIYKEKGEHELIEVPMDNNMFMNNYMKSLIDYYFKN